MQKSTDLQAQFALLYSVEALLGSNETCIAEWKSWKCVNGLLKWTEVAAHRYSIWLNLNTCEPEA